MRTFLSIAGSDPSGGAGIQADLKTASAMGVYGMSVITALTAQNTMGVKDVLYIDEKFFRIQLRTVLEDIVPDAIKIGMMGGDHISGIIVEEIERFNIKNIVLDPVMVSSSGDVLVTMRLGGETQFMATATSVNDIKEIYQYAKQHKLPVFVLGGGSNVIVRDEEYQGVVLVNSLKGFDVIEDDGSTVRMKVAAGEVWDEVVARSVEMGLQGIEAMSAIPDTTGAEIGRAHV